MEMRMGGTKMLRPAASALALGTSPGARVPAAPSYQAASRSAPLGGAGAARGVAGVAASSRLPRRAAAAAGQWISRRMSSHKNSPLYEKIRMTPGCVLVATSVVERAREGGRECVLTTTSVLACLAVAPAWLLEQGGVSAPVTPRTFVPLPTDAGRRATNQQRNHSHNGAQGAG